MRRSIVAAMLALLATVSVVSAQRTQPVFISENGRSLAAVGTVPAYGDVTVTLVATGTMSVVCVSPSGVNVPPVQMPAPITLVGQQVVTAQDGLLHFGVSTIVAPFALSSSPDCPGPQWIERVERVTFTRAMLRLDQQPFFGQPADSGILMQLDCPFQLVAEWPSGLEISAPVCTRVI